MSIGITSSAESWQECEWQREWQREWVAVAALGKVLFALIDDASNDFTRTSGAHTELEKEMKRKIPQTCLDNAYTFIDTGRANPSTHSMHM